MSHTMAEMWAIPVEELRTWYVERCAMSTIREVAADVGVGHSTLFALVSGKTRTLQPRIRKVLAGYYLAHRGDDDSQRVENAKAAFRTAASFFPEPARARVVLHLLATAEAEYLAAGQDVPGWLRALRS